MYLSLALQNLWLQRRRAAVTIFSVTLGFTALSLVSGVINNVFVYLQMQAVQVERLGHLTIARKGFFTEGKLDPEKYIFSAEELGKARAILEADPHVTLVSPRLNIFGVISNGQVSTIFLSEGIVPEHDTNILNAGGESILDAGLGDGSYTGGKLDSANNNGVALGEELAHMLGLKKGDEAVLFTTTVEGMANALDVNVLDVYNTGNPATNDKFVLAPYQLSGKLYDTQGAERLVVLLDDINTTEAARVRLAGALAAAEIPVEIKTWNERSLFYEKVQKMFGVVFRVVSIITFVVVVMTVFNTMAAAVSERTREIGTLRAIGMRSRRVVRLFATEGALIAVIGCTLAVPLTLLAAALINSAGISFVPPVSSTAVPVEVRLVVPRMVALFGVFVVLSGAASILPARKAARSPIVDALGHV